MTLDQFLRDAIRDINYPKPPEMHPVVKWVLLPFVVWKHSREGVPETKPHRSLVDHFIQKSTLLFALLMGWGFLHVIVTWIGGEHLSTPLYWFLIVFTAYVLFVGSALFARVRHHFSWDEQQKRARLQANRDAHGGQVQFDDATYATAAEALRGWKSATDKQAKAKYPEDVRDLLWFADGIFWTDEKWRRLVSIRAIEEDREAGFEDDEEEEP